jgi:putative SOS response-associated peptidase YedK
MCGRVRVSSDYSEIKIKLKFDGPPPNFERDWNKPPTAPMLVALRSMDGKRTPKMMRWGLLPHWAKDEKIAYSTFNARAEEFTGKPAFRDAWKNGQRCLVVTDGFYEWKKLDPKGKEKQPYAIAMADNGQMVMAGLWANVCVESTARDGFMLDYNIVFLSDCTATASPGAHEATLQNIGSFFGTVVTSDEVLAVWRSKAPARAVA